MTRRTRAAALAVALLSFLTVLPVAADESLFIYRRIYRFAESLQQKYSAVLAVSAADDPAAAPVLAEVLDDLLLIQANYDKPADRELHARIVRDVVAKLGQWRYVEAATSVFQAVEQMTEPLAKAEALMALGSMRATDYADRIALLLRNLNFGPGLDPAGNEKVAFGAVIALEKLRQGVGFAPVFFASDGWYGRRVRDLATRALPSVAADPTDPVIEIIRLEGVDRKIKALDLELASKATAARKLEAVAAAVKTAVEFVAKDKPEGLKIQELRQKALRGFVTLDGSGGSLVPLFQTVYKEGPDVNDRLLALQAMGVDGSEAAAVALRDIIIQLDDQQRRGVSDERRDQLIKAAIQYAAMTGSKTVSISLQAVQINDRWSNSVITLATEALKTLK